jgi:hypothetical protein
MVEIKCRTISKPPNGTRLVYRKNNVKKIAARILAIVKTNHSYKVVMVKSLTTSAEIVAIYLQRMFHKAKYLLI